MGRHFLATLIFVIVGLPAIASESVSELEGDIDVVWSSSDGIKMEIYYSQRHKGGWLKPVQVTDDYYDNMYPVIDRDSSGKRWIFWTAYDRGRMEIHYTSGDGEEWSTADVLSSDNKTNISPSVVIDDQDRIWVAWSANNGDLDDIMYAFYQNGFWSDPTTVHDPNEDPDLLPVIEIGGDGVPQVRWQAVRAGENVILLSKWIDNEWSIPKIEAAKSRENDDKEENSLELPSFVNQTSMVFIRLY